MLRIVRPDEVPVEEYHISTGRLCKKNSSLLAAINKIPLICSSKCPFFKKRSQNAIDSRLSLNEHLYNQPSDVHANSYPDLDTRGRGGIGWNSSPEFLICSRISKWFYLYGKAFDLHNKMRYISWVVPLLEACDVTNNGRHLGCNLAFYQELGIRLKLREMVICALHEK